MPRSYAKSTDYDLPMGHQNPLGMIATTTT